MRLRHLLLFGLTTGLFAPLPAQLPLLTAPRGTMRIEFGGSFHPTTTVWRDGAKQDLGEVLTLPALTASSTPLLADLEARLGQLLGRPATATRLGGLTTTAELQRGVGTIGLALGITRRITIFGTVPIVSVRSQHAIGYNPDGSTVGANPADPTLGSAAGRVQTAAFFDSFDAALATLAQRYTRGDYTSDPTKQALAQQTLTNAPLLRNSLYALLSDSATASAVLPTGSSADGSALLGQIGAVRNTLTNDLGISSFTGAPALPTVPLDSAGFTALLSSPTGFDLAAPEDRPLVGIGDIEGGVTAELLQRGHPGEASWLGLWVQGLGRFRTGQLPRANYLFDQGTGDRQLDAEVAAIVELGRHRLGLRAEGRYTMQLASDRFARVAPRDQLLVPTTRRAAVHSNPGDILQVTAQPFFRLAPRLAFTGLVSYWRRGADVSSYVAGQTAVGPSGVNAEVLDPGSAADALLVGVGFSYSHDGVHRDGIRRMPVEAGFSIERTVRSGRGLVPASLTSRLVFRVYKALIKH
ncbi:MAG: hypothetical protein ABJC19_03055 [Gemmatimonadota bacterium]